MLTNEQEGAEETETTESGTLLSLRPTFCALGPPAPPRNRTDKPTAQLECSTLTQIAYPAK